MAKRKFPHLDDRHLIAVCEQFLEGKSASATAAWLNEELCQEDSNLSVTREQIYALLNDARKRGYFYIRPPLQHILDQRIADLYRKNVNRIQVVNTWGLSAHGHVASEAAALALQLIKELGTYKHPEPVHVGLGAGFTTRATAQHLASFFRAEEQLPPLVIHALSTGFKADEPLIAPAAFFGLFENISPRISYVGLFALAIVPSEDYTRVKGLPGIKESFALAHDIDIAITSLASANDEHGTLNQFLDAHPDDIELLREQGWVGDVQYRPFSSSGPILQEASIRAVTLFELAEFVKLARAPHKYVIVVAGPCGQCGRTRSDALRPLLTVPNLAVWSHLVMDLKTAQELVVDEVSTTVKT